MSHNFLEAQREAQAANDPPVRVKLPLGAGDAVSIGGILYTADKQSVVSVPTSALPSLFDHLPGAQALTA